jgi:hypothetical protein
MKQVFTVFVFIFCAGSVYAQNFFQVSMSQPKCFNACDGNATYASTLTGGPFTAVLTNTGSCPNSTTQSSTGNTITVSNICACASIYTVSFFNSSNIIVGTELLQVPITATAPLILQTPSLTPAACPGCCNGQMYVDWSGGYVPLPSNPTITLDNVDISMNTAPYASVCVGSHTLCVEDLAGCKVCTTFSMTYVITVGINESALMENLIIYPNPFEEFIHIKHPNDTEILNVKLFSLEGRLLHYGELTVDGVLKTSNLEKGLYLLELRNQAGNAISKKIQKR